MGKLWQSVFVFLSVWLALGLFGWIRWREPAFDRPLEEDETITVNVYSWAETEPSGEHREIANIDEYRKIGSPTPRELLMGLYCAAGRWSEPNNHIVHSLLVNASQVIRRSERWVRLPALVGAVVFSAALFVLCGPVLKWWGGAPLVLVLAWFSPYLHEFSETARGYSWSLALLTLWLIAVHKLAGRPRSLVLGSLCTFLAAAIFLNIVNLSVDWLFPAYLVLLVCSPSALRGGAKAEETPGASAGEGGAEGSSPGRAWRVNLLVQGLVIGTIGVMFLIAHLPAVVSSARQYGEGFGAMGELVHLLSGSLRYLFPGIPGMIVGGVSLIGLGCLLVLRPRIYVTWMSVAVVGFSLLHFAGTHRYPYDRVLGYFLIPALLGTAFLVDLVWRRIPSHKIRIATAIILPAVATLAAPSLLAPVGVNGLEPFLAELKAQPTPADRWTFPLLGSGVDAGVHWYVPSSWQSPSVLTPGHEAQVCLLLRGRRGIGVTSGETSMDWLPSTAPAESSTPFRVVRLVGQTKELTYLPATRALVFWYPDYLRLGIDAHGQLELAKKSGLKFQRVTTRQRIKLDLFGRLFSLIFIAESDKDYQTAVKTVEEGIARFGGSGVVFVY